jgi:ribosomal protein L37AE/L43A
MASFKGTNQELRRYIGPRLRNLVQQITKRHKAEIAACHHCGAIENLESAHVRDRNRNEIIDLIAGKYTANGIIDIDLGVFEETFKTEHRPIEKSILILCRPCHKKYDGGKTKSTSNQSVEKAVVQNSRSSADRNDVLPITLSPSDPTDFRGELLLSKKAEIQSYYSDGRVEKKPWNASRFSASSNVMGNLRTRSEFKSGNWKSRGVVKVHVKVIKNA